MRVIFIAAARPNFMKVAPVLAALRARAIDVTLVHTGQHYDEAMSAVFFEELGLPEPDVHLGVGSGTHAEQTAGVMVAFEPVVAEFAPEVVIVVGDVNSTLACALVAAKAQVPVAHVEAGLRSHDWSMPEEVNRVVTDRVSDLLFAPSPDAVDNLRAEGVDSRKIHLVGNVMVDTLLNNLDRALARPVLKELGVTPGQYALATLHRPANVDDDAVLLPILEALETVGAQCPVILPAHPRVRARLDKIDHRHVTVIDPAGYLDFIALEAQARVVLTDSGGVQEETTVLGVPCLTLRDNTERPITVEQGTNRVVGRDPTRIVGAATDVLRVGVEPRRPELWDGHAGDRIAEALIRYRP